MFKPGCDSNIFSKYTMFSFNFGCFSVDSFYLVDMKILNQEFTDDLKLKTSQRYVLMSNLLRTGVRSRVF